VNEIVISETLDHWTECPESTHLESARVGFGFVSLHCKIVSLHFTSLEYNNGVRCKGHYLENGVRCKGSMS